MKDFSGRLRGLLLERYHPTYQLNSYPESAILNVNLEDMVAWIKVRRYHRPPASAGEQGFS